MESQMFLVFHVDVVTPGMSAGSVRVAQPVETGLYFESRGRCERNAEKRVRRRLERLGCMVLGMQFGNVLVREG